MEIIPIWAFAIDIIVTLNTSFYYKGTLQSEKSKILKHYVKTQLNLDIITLGPFLFVSLLNTFNNNKFLEILFVLRIIKMKKLIKKIKENLILPENMQGTIELFRLFFFVLYLAHICGCAWHYVAMQEIKMGYQKTWIHSNNLIDENITIRF